MEDEEDIEDELEAVPFIRSKDQGTNSDDEREEPCCPSVGPNGLDGIQFQASHDVWSSSTMTGQQAGQMDLSTPTLHRGIKGDNHKLGFNGAWANRSDLKDHEVAHNNLSPIDNSQVNKTNHQEDNDGHGLGQVCEILHVAEVDVNDNPNDETKERKNADLQSSQEYTFLCDSIHTKMGESYTFSKSNSSITSSTCEDALSLLNMKRSINEQTQTLNYFNFLPTELILHIFSYLLTHELCRHVSPVCRQWRQLAMDQSLWKSIDLSAFRHLNSLNLLWVVRQAPSLQKLVIRGRHNISMAEVAIMTEFCPVLQEINLGFCEALNCDMIQWLVKNCRKLTKINVEGCGKIDSKCIRLLTRSPRLSYFNFSHCSISDYSLKFLCKNVEHLISINLDGIPFITDSAVVTMVNKHENWLQELELDGAEISDESFKFISKCSQLKCLSVSFCECLTDEGLLYLKNLKNLEVLRLRKGTDFSVKGLIAYFCDASLSKLHSLNMSECAEITDSVVLEIVKSCGSHLRQLDLAWCWAITERGLISIVDHCSNLRVLDLLGIDKIRGECLPRIPEEMPYLKFLDLQQCNMIVDSLIYDVVSRKPDLQVLNYYGENFVYG